MVLRVRSMSRTTGLTAANKGRDIRIETPDGETLGAWHIL
jgi:hypothetical protein